MDGKVIESKRWKNKATGATASLHGAVPWTNAADEANWEIEVVGWTIQWDNGTIGCGRPPWATKRDAELFLELTLYRKAIPGDDVHAREGAAEEICRLIMEGATFPQWAADARDDFFDYAIFHNVPMAYTAAELAGANVTRRPGS